MTPAARAQAAIEILDSIADGAAAEKALTNWARAARYAGSGDRAAVRDLVFDTLRRWRSAAVAGGGDSGRARILGLMRQRGVDPAEIFTGAGHGPAPLSDGERLAGRMPTESEARDFPDDLWPLLLDGRTGAEAAAIAETLKHRAPVFLRVNLLKADRDAAIAALAADGIVAEPALRAETALRLRDGERKVAGSRAFRDGLVELQDASSQAVVEALPTAPGMRALDFCAGGGGKALALAARLGGAGVDAHDADPRRMRDLPTRAARAGARIEIVDAPRRTYDLVLCDVPCSGSGAWRRAPEAKWRLTAEAVATLGRLQTEILLRAARHVAPAGRLVYVTCSVLRAENERSVAAFCDANPDWRIAEAAALDPGWDGDGFFRATLLRRDAAS